MLLAFTPTPTQLPTPPPTIGTTDIWILIFTGLATAIAIGSLIVSIINHNQTVASKYNGCVYPAGRIKLSWMGDNPCIFADCIFMNRGAKPGNVEDLILLMRDQSGSGTKTAFRSVLKVVTADFADLSQEDDLGQSLENFSVVWLNGNQAVKQTVIFVPNNCPFDIQGPTQIEEQLSFHSFDPRETNRARWKTSEVTYRYAITESNITDWKTERLTVTLESVQLVDSRSELFRSL